MGEGAAGRRRRAAECLGEQRAQREGVGREGSGWRHGRRRRGCLGRRVAGHWREAGVGEDERAVGLQARGVGREGAVRLAEAMEGIDGGKEGREGGGEEAGGGRARRGLAEKGEVASGLWIRRDECSGG